MRRDYKCSECNKTYAIQAHRDTHQRQCREKRLARDKWIKENPDKAKKLKLT